MSKFRIQQLLLGLMGVIILTLNCSNAKPIDSKQVGNTNYSRIEHQAILLDDGRVLVEGGTHATWTAEYYEPKTQRFYKLPDMHNLRMHGEHSLTKLPDGRILLIGGLPYPDLEKPSSHVGYGTYYTSCENYYTDCTNKERLSKDIEVFDPKTNQFNVVAKLPSGVGNNSTLVLNNGQVLIFSNKEIYLMEPNANQLSKWGDFPTWTNGITAIQLSSDKIFLINGVIDKKNYTHNLCGYILNILDKKIEIIDYHRTISNFPKKMYKLPNGRIALILSGSRTIQFFSPDLKAITDEPISKIPRDSYVSVLMLPDGRFLTVGGDLFPKNQYPIVQPSTVEIYDPITHFIQNAGTLKFYRSSPSLTLLKDGSVLVIDGDLRPEFGNSPEYSTAEILIVPKRDESNK